jgi:hypothetical protein
MLISSYQIQNLGFTFSKCVFYLTNRISKRHIIFLNLIFKNLDNFLNVGSRIERVCGLFIASNRFMLTN